MPSTQITCLTRAVCRWISEKGWSILLLFFVFSFKSCWFHCPIIYNLNYEGIISMHKIRLAHTKHIKIQCTLNNGDHIRHVFYFVGSFVCFFGCCSFQSNEKIRITNLRFVFVHCFTMTWTLARKWDEWLMVSQWVFLVVQQCTGFYFGSIGIIARADEQIFPAACE